MAGISGLAGDVVAGRTRQNAIFPHNAATSHNWYNSGRISSAYPGVMTGKPWVTPWGVIYRAKDAPLDPDVLLKVRNLEAYRLSSGGVWSRLGSEFRPNGNWYDEVNVATSTTAPRLSAAPNAFITSLAEGYCFHFFWLNQLEYDPADTAHWVVSFEAKLISASGADISGRVGTFVAQTGIDCRVTPAGTPSDMYVGTFRPVETSFRKFYGTTAALADLMLYPPPAELAQLTTLDPQGLDPDYVAP